MILSNKQIENFNNNGFIVLKKFADLKLCDEILTKALLHLQNRKPPIESEDQYQQITDNNNNNNTIRRLRQVYDRENIFSQWMENNEIRPILNQLLNDKAILVLAHHNSIMTKQPLTSTVTSWHQDIRYWNYENDMLISVWLSLGDEHIENGLLEFIPESHKMNFTEDQFDNFLSFKNNINKNKQVIAKRTHFNLGKGDIVIFHAKTLHHAHQNKTNKPKISFVYTVRASSNRPIKNTISDFKEVILD